MVKQQLIWILTTLATETQKGILMFRISIDGTKMKLVF